MKRAKINNDWFFKPSTSIADKNLKSGKVNLPHDYSILQQRTPDCPSGNRTGFFNGGLAYYEKRINIDSNNKKVILEFEGIYMNATIHFNNQFIKRHPYGYTSFHCDVSKYVKYNQENIIKVTVNNSTTPNSRWYSGSGIYRNVYMLTSDNLYFEPWGLQIATPKVSKKKSQVSIKASILNESNKDKNINIKYTITDINNDQISQEISSLCLKTGKNILNKNITINNSKLWSIDNPNLYYLSVEILKDNTPIDSISSHFGIREISISTDKGFTLNGKQINLKGGCVHHDCGILGAKSFDNAEKRKVKLLKENGFNAVRLAHNPSSIAFLDYCDKFGLLVIDEAFDCWREAKNVNDYGMYFEKYWEEDISSMVKRDVNHPSIIMWSTGNEIVERSGISEGYEYSKKLANKIRSIDNTRFITNGLNNILPSPTVNGLYANLQESKDDKDYFGELSEKFVKPLDIVGYNYLVDRYVSDGQKYPNRIIVGSETFPKDAFEYWEKVEKLSYVIGDFVWTALDYLGEAGLGHVWYNGEDSFFGNFPWHLANCGDLDICGFKRPQSYYRDCVWGISKKPYIAVHMPDKNESKADISAWGWPEVINSWTFDNYNGNVVIDVYCQSKEVELIVNNKSIGRKKAGKANKYIATFETEYQQGEITAIAYENGNEISRQTLKTSEEPYRIELTPDKTTINANGEDLCYIECKILDKFDNLVTNSDLEINLSVSKNASLIAFGSANPLSTEMYTLNRRTSHLGKALAIVKSTNSSGKIKISAFSETVPVTTIEIDSKQI